MLGLGILVALMAIPSKFDHRMSEIDDAAGKIMVQLRTMQHANPADIVRMRAVLRERLQSYVSAVLALADQSGT
jgi:hypothetical protein